MVGCVSGEEQAVNRAERAYWIRYSVVDELQGNSDRKFKVTTTKSVKTDHPNIQTGEAPISLSFHSARSAVQINTKSLHRRSFKYTYSYLEQKYPQQQQQHRELRLFK